MAVTRKVLALALASAAAIGISASASATITISGTVDGDAISFILNAPSAPGWAMYQASLHGVQISAQLSGYPFISSPQFSTAAFEISSDGAHSVIIDEIQTGLPGTFPDLLSTATLNSVTGGVDMNVTGFSGADQLLSLSKSGTGTVSSTLQSGGVASPDQLVRYTFNFSGASQSASGSYQIAAVPEAATWMMMVAGFGLMGAAMRRRPRTQVTFA